MKKLILLLFIPLVSFGQIANEIKPDSMYFNKKGEIEKWKYYENGKWIDMKFIDGKWIDKNGNEQKPFTIIENAPEYIGCKGSKYEKRNCLSKKISIFVQRNFNLDLASGLGLTGRQRISVNFKIGKRGNVIDVKARAPHPRLEEEAVRVINLLPKFKPGKHKGKAVIVPYSLPILYQVKEEKKEEELEPQK
tara:strand:- start:660 stop:1235 length:576 start_codon:yes stop_codon:yes gene_type:complete